MYADRVETAPKSSIKDRLNGGALDNSRSRRQITGKRQRQNDDKWEHDLYEQADPQISNRRVGVLDLRLKLQKKSNQQATQGARGPLSGGVRDLREKLSGITYSLPAVTVQAKPKSVPESSKSTRRSVVAEAPVAETKKVANIASKKKKAETVDTFLQALGLEKYSITFQAEEVDMTALLHMTDEDLKAIGIPMGPRKKILLALESKA
ncbi:Usher syndrome type-1G protein [Cynara cardunculus var. scolymus]|uniref:Sterile alpha motif domain-containing protein n=1 Tax=Cynara cardunculus var. scolymus TaxID=59895 RepID=A0A118K250_CYNCS|nr:Usher syndrome type-1G protein [Cynara cardunculus var. scolymus]KVI03813.1 Sterile alpha motif domain-containing protein [Cynara cardunculus var. scolymus]